MLESTFHEVCDESGTKMAKKGHLLLKIPFIRSLARVNGLTCLSKRQAVTGRWAGGWYSPVYSRRTMYTL